MTAETRTSSGPLTRAPAVALVGGAICSVQFGSAIAAKLFDQVGSTGVAMLRLVSAAIILVALWRPRLARRSGRELALGAALGGVLAGMNISFYAALDRIPLGIAVTIEFIGPLAVAVVGSRRRLDFLWVLLAVGGILALTRGSTHHLSTLGILFALLAGGFWGTYIHLNSRVGRAFEGGTGISFAMCVGAAVSLPFGVAAGGPHLLSVHAILVGSAVGVLSSAIPYSFENEALRRIQPGIFAVFMSLEPAVAALAGFLILDQALDARAIVGIALVIAASIGASRRAREAPVDV